MKLLISWRTYAVLLSIALAVIIFSRCTPTDTQSQSTQVPTALPTPVEVEPTPSPEPDEITPVVEESETPKVKPKVEPSVSKTKEKIPSAKKSAMPKPTLSNEPSPPTSQEPTSQEPTSTPQPVESPKPSVTPKPGRTPNEYGYVVPLVSFTTKSCVIKGDFVRFTYTVFLSEGNHYSYQEPWRGGQIWTVRDGRSWSFEHVETVSSRAINNPNFTYSDRTLRIIGDGDTDYIPLPKFDFSTCK